MSNLHIRFFGLLKRLMATIPGIGTWRWLHNHHGWLHNDFEILLPQKFERENPKNDNSENDVDVDSDPPDVLTPPYIPTMM